MKQTVQFAALVLLAAVWSISCIAADQRFTTIRIQLPAGAIAMVTFDPARFSKDEVSRWMEFSEHGRYALPLDLFPTDCSPEKRKGEISALQADIPKARQLIADLDPAAYPTELTKVIVYLKSLQSFWLWQAEQEVGYITNGEIPGLEWQNVDARERCGGSMEKLRNATNLDAGCKIVFFDWHNCTNDASLHQLGPYPKEDWEAFLRAYGIQVQMIPIPDAD
jgi:hypothetical protein